MTDVCVLTFHRLVETPGRDHDVTWDAFGELLDRVATVGTSVVSELEPPAERLSPYGLRVRPP